RLVPHFLELVVDALEDVRQARRPGVALDALAQAVGVGDLGFGQALDEALDEAALAPIEAAVDVRERGQVEQHALHLAGGLLRLTAEGEHALSSALRFPWMTTPR